LLPTLSCLSVSTSLVSCLRNRGSGWYLCISPLHHPFRQPRLDSSPAVSMAVLQLSCRLSPRTYRATYAPFKPNKSGQRSHPPYYRGCWHGVSRCFFNRYRRFLPQEFFLPGQKPFTTQKAFIRHAAWLGQSLLHCPIFPTAASRRSLARISVPVWGIGLSAPLAIVALVRRYRTN
jgi:hypothetical protein